MIKIHLTRTQYFILSVVSLVLLISNFLLALMFPSENVKFIFDTAVVLFLVEFLTIVFSFYFTKPTKTRKERRQLFLILILASICIVFIGIASQTLIPPIFFVISLFSKFSQNKASENPHILVFYIVLVLLTVSAAALTESFWVSTFPIDQEIVLENVPITTSSKRMLPPQVLLAWGVLYYTTLLVINVVYFLRKNRKIRTKK